LSPFKITHPEENIVKKTLFSRSFSLFLLGIICVSHAPAGVTVEEPDKTKHEQKIPLEKVRPQWKVGDQWIVETQTRQMQKRSSKTKLSPSVQWKFHVVKIEPLFGKLSYRIEITGVDKTLRTPKTILWIDQKSQVIRQIQTELPVQGGFRTVTESYEHRKGQPSPVIGLLTALPLDMPLFLSGTKSLGNFQYETISGPAGTKAIGEIGFSYSIKQSSQNAKPEEVTKALGDHFTKSLKKNPSVSIQLKNPERKVDQIWQSKLPWPVYSNNGSTEARLVKFTPAKKDSQ
jgi:hypothetical protein